MTIERPMFPPVDPTRRRVLTVAAAGAVAGLLPIAALASAIDPVFELIEAHRETHAVHMAALKLQDSLERKRGFGSGTDWVSTKPCHDENDAFEALIAEPATTVSGLHAKLAYLQELAGEFETEWMINDQAQVTVLIQSFAASLKNIGVQP